MNEVYTQEFHVRWSDLDPNRHMRHSAYADLCAATRFSYLELLGFNMATFAKLQMGPIIFTETLNYFSEVLAGEKLIVNVRISGLSEDGRKWKMHQEILKKSDGKVAATLDISGAWFDLKSRKVVAAPKELRDQVDNLPRTQDFHFF